MAVFFLGCSESALVEVDQNQPGPVTLAVDSGEAGPTMQSPVVLSATLGVSDIPIPWPLASITGCPQKVGDEGLPVVFNVQVDERSLSPKDFTVTTASGARIKPTCATLRPANESDELYTVLLAGPLGSSTDLPVMVEVTGNVRSLDKESLRGLQSPPVDYGQEGPTLELAFLDSARPACSSLGASTEIALTFNGGVTGPARAEFTTNDLDGFHLLDTTGGSYNPLGFDDLNDNDNHVVVCVPEGVVASQVTVEESTVYSVTNNPNKVDLNITPTLR